MDFLRALPWKWIVPVLVIVALGSAVRAYAGALGRADAAADRVEKLEVELALIEDSNESLEEALADADSSKAVQARADSLRLAELAFETEELERTVRDLAAEDRRNAEGVNVALRDLGAVLLPGAVPALRQLTGAYETRITGLSDQVVALTGIVAAKDENIEILEAELGAERFARSAADELLRGLRVELRLQVEIIETQEIEIGALRDAVAPGFLLRFFQNIELVIASVGAGVGACLAFCP